MMRLLTRKSLNGFSLIVALSLVLVLILSSLNTRAAAPEWQPDTAYAAGALVSYGGSEYKCLQAHTSQVGWEPANVPALWEKQSGSSEPTATPSHSVSSPTPTRTTAPPATTNMLKNGGFELDSNGDGKVDSWAKNDYVSRSGEQKHTKSFSMKHQSSANNSYIIGQTVNGIVAGQSYNLSTWTFIPDTSDSFTFKIEIVWKSGATQIGSPVLIKSWAAATGNTWRQAQGTRVAPAGADTAVVRMNVGSLNAVVYADDYVLKLASPVTPTPTRSTTSVTPTVTPTGSPTPTIEVPPGGLKKIAYFAQWGIYARGYFIKNIDTSGSAAKLTHINYSFGNVVNNRCEVGINQLGRGDAWADYQKGFSAAESVDGVADVWEQPIKGNFNQLKKLKAKYPHLKVLISLGGWTWSGGFSSAAQPANRAAFVQSCIDIYIKGNIPADAGSGVTGGPGAAAGIFDGIDIDWEYPAACGLQCGVPEDTANFTELIKEFRRQLDAVRPGLLLTAAMPAGIDKITGKIQGAAIEPSMDYINLMTYDFFGAWAATGPVAPHSPLYAWAGMPTSNSQDKYYSDYAVDAWVANGFPKSKINLGVPFYGRGWTGVSGGSNGGLNGTATGAAPCSGFTGCEAGISDYKVLKTKGHPRFAGAGTMWTYNGTEWWSYDDAATMAGKMAYIKSKGLGGAMAWSLDGDTANGELMSAIHTGLQ